MSEDDELNRLRQQTERSSRVEEASGQEERRQLAEAIREQLKLIDQGERQKTVSAWNGPLAALFAALDDRPEDLQQLVAGLEQQLDVSIDEDPKRSEVVALALRLGVQEAAPETMDALRNAVQKQAAENL